MGGGKSGSSTQVTKVELPKWVEEASQSNYGLAQEIAAKPYQPYTGQRVADASPVTQSAIDYLTKNVGSQNGAMGAAQNSLAGIMGYAPQSVAGTGTNIGYDVISSRDVAPGTIGYGTVGNGVVDVGSIMAGLITPKTVAGADLSPYMNPFTNEVEKYALDAVSRQGALNQNAIKSNSATAKAFGGSRQGIMEGISLAETAREAGDLSANLRKANYDNANNLLIGDITRDMTAQTQNVANRMDADKFNVNARLDADKFNVGTALDADKFNVNTRLTADTQNVTNKLTADTGNADRTLKSDMANQATRLAADQSNQSTSLSERLADQKAQEQAARLRYDASLGLANVADTQRAGLMADVGALFNAGSVQQGIDQARLDEQYGNFTEARDYDTERLNLLLASLGMSPYGRTETTNKTEKSSGGSDWATAALGGANLLKGIIGMSEDKMKTDKEKIGKIPGTDLDAWAYRYKKDKKNTPKIIGVMASDVAKKMPKAIVDYGKGVRGVDYGYIREQGGRI